VFKKIINKFFIYNKSIYMKPIVVGFPRTGFTLLISIITEILLLKNFKFKKEDIYLKSKINQVDIILSQNLMDYLNKNFKKKDIIFNKNFHPLFGGPMWIEKNNQEYIFVRKYIGIKGQGDMSLIISLPQKYVNHLIIPHSHGPYEPWIKKNLRFASIRSPLGTINSACHSINAITSEYLKKFYPEISGHDTKIIREKLALSKLSNLKIFEALVKPMKENFLELIKFKDSFYLTKWEDIITSPTNTIIKISENLNLPIKNKDAQKIWDKLKFKNLTGEHQHNFRNGGGKIGNEYECLTIEHINILKEYGFEEIQSKFGYKPFKKINIHQYNDFQIKLSKSISDKSPINEINDIDLNNFAFQKTNIDFKSFNFKVYDWKKYTRIERTNIKNNKLIEDIWNIAENTLKEVNIKLN